ncbi:hypothetical protein DFJ73DRAFT_834305 [Zopfochytrium polystomum]|nr:hypothetical protein DFJ73DRAFT_834305 [Zopfochytrium polystomum]
MLAMVRCGHAFHHDCLHAWLMRSEEREMRCPLCRTRAFEEDEGGGQGGENRVEA